MPKTQGQSPRGDGPYRPPSEKSIVKKAAKSNNSRASSDSKTKKNVAKARKGKGAF